MKTISLAAAFFAALTASAQAFIISAGDPTLELDAFEPGAGGDVFTIDFASFGASSKTVFVNANPSVDGLGLIDPLPRNVTPIIVVQGRDRFLDQPSEPFLAGTAGFEIADALEDEPGRKGFFLYWNSIQQRNRLVFSEDITRQAAGLGDLSIVAEIYGGDFRREDGLIERHAAGMRGASRQGYRLQLLAMLGWTSAHWLWSLRQPTLVMAGTDDPLVPVGNARFLAAMIPGAELSLLDNGHLFLATRPAESARMIEAFLDRDD